MIKNLLLVFFVFEFKDNILTFSLKIIESFKINLWCFIEWLIYNIKAAKSNKMKLYRTLNTEFSYKYFDLQYESDCIHATEYIRIAEISNHMIEWYSFCTNLCLFIFFLYVQFMFFWGSKSYLEVRYLCHKIQLMCFQWSSTEKLLKINK